MIKILYHFLIIIIIVSCFTRKRRNLQRSLSTENSENIENLVTPDFESVVIPGEDVTNIIAKMCHKKPYLKVESSENISLVKNYQQLQDLFQKSTDVFLSVCVSDSVCGSKIEFSSLLIDDDFMENIADGSYLAVEAKNCLIEDNCSNSSIYLSAYDTIDLGVEEKSFLKVRKCDDKKCYSWENVPTVASFHQNYLWKLPSCQYYTIDEARDILPPIDENVDSVSFTVCLDDNTCNETVEVKSEEIKFKSQKDDVEDLIESVGIGAGIAVGLNLGIAVGFGSWWGLTRVGKDKKPIANQQEFGKKVGENFLNKNYSETKTASSSGRSVIVLDGDGTVFEGLYKPGGTKGVPWKKSTLESIIRLAEADHFVGIASYNFRKGVRDDINKDFDEAINKSWNENDSFKRNYPNFKDFESKIKRNFHVELPKSRWEIPLLDVQGGKKVLLDRIVSAASKEARLETPDMVALLDDKYMFHDAMRRYADSKNTTESFKNTRFLSVKVDNELGDMKASDVKRIGGDVTHLRWMAGLADKAEYNRVLDGLNKSLDDQKYVALDGEDLSKVMTKSTTSADKLRREIFTANANEPDFRYYVYDESVKKPVLSQYLNSEGSIKQQTPDETSKFREEKSRFSQDHATKKSKLYRNRAAGAFGILTIIGGSVGGLLEAND